MTNSEPNHVESRFVRVTVRTKPDGSDIACGVPFGEAKVTIRRRPEEWKNRATMSPENWKAFS